LRVCKRDLAAAGRAAGGVGRPNDARAQCWALRSVRAAGWIRRLPNLWAGTGPRFREARQSWRSSPADRCTRRGNCSAQRAVTLTGLGRGAQRWVTRSAIEATRSSDAQLETAIRLKPDFEGAHFRLGVIRFLLAQ
jgi:hypothetical protein